MNDVTSAHLAILGLTGLSSLVLFFLGLVLSGLRNSIIALAQSVEQNSKDIAEIRTVLDLRGLTLPNGQTKHRSTIPKQL
jgi:hypothetical protein